MSPQGTSNENPGNERAILVDAAAFDERLTVEEGVRSFAPDAIMTCADGVFELTPRCIVAGLARTPITDGCPRDDSIPIDVADWSAAEA